MGGCLIQACQKNRGGPVKQAQTYKNTIESRSNLITQHNHCNKLTNQHQKPSTIEQTKHHRPFSNEGTKSQSKAVGESRRASLYLILAYYSHNRHKFTKQLIEQFLAQQLYRDNQQRAYAHVIMGEIHLLQQQHQKGIQQLERGLQYFKAEETQFFQEIISILNSVGLYYDQAKQLQESRGWYEQSMRLMRKYYSSSDGRYLLVCNNLACVYSQSQQKLMYAKGIRLFEYILDKIQQQYGQQQLQSRIELKLVVQQNYRHYLTHQPNFKQQPYTPQPEQKTKKSVASDTPLHQQAHPRININSHHLLEGKDELRQQILCVSLKQKALKQSSVDECGELSLSGCRVEQSMLRAERNRRQNVNEMKMVMS